LLNTGEHIQTETHLHHLQIYGENSCKVASRLSYFIAGLNLTVKTLKTLYQGVDGKIVAAVEGCHRVRVEVKLDLVILGRDPLVQGQDYNNLVNLAVSKHIPIYKQIFEREDHSSVAYNWELIDALEAL
jgi:hypothetical protein